MPADPSPHETLRARRHAAGLPRRVAAKCLRLSATPPSPSSTSTARLTRKPASGGMGAEL